jgi:hypothetical protein
VEAEGVVVVTAGGMGVVGICVDASVADGTQEVRTNVTVKITTMVFFNMALLRGLTRRAEIVADFREV